MTQAALDHALTGAFGAKRQVYVLGEIWSRRDQTAGLVRQSPGLSGADVQALFRDYTLVPAWNGPRGTAWRVLAPAPRPNPGE